MLMHVIDLTHYLDGKGCIAPECGPARKMANFLVTVVAHASDFDRADDTPGPGCFKCSSCDDRRVETGMTEDETIAWRCPACGSKGLISNWRETFWDLSHGMLSS